MLELEAEIYLYQEEEGGMTKEGFSGMMPSFNVENNLIMCRVNSNTNQTTIKRGQSHQVNIQLPYGEEYRESIFVGYHFTLMTGKRTIASGKVVSINKE